MEWPNEHNNLISHSKPRIISMIQDNDIEASTGLLKAPINNLENELKRLYS